MPRLYARPFTFGVTGVTPARRLWHNPGVVSRLDFNRVADVYDAGRGLPEEALEAWREAVAPYFPAVDRPLVLDLGCGTGRFAVALARWFNARVVGVDVAAQMLRRAAAHPHVDYVLGDAQRAPLRDASVDAVWLSTVIHHVPDLPACARELRRVLRPDRPVVVRSWFPGRADVLHFRYFPASRRHAETFPTIEETIDAFAAAGFRMEALESVPQTSAASLAEFRDRVRLRADTTLQAISDDEFAAGLAALDRDVAAETAPAPVISRLDLLVLR
jgi:ubiquinone/menaquinone biosynthesis C-methylase UbiE